MQNAHQSHWAKLGQAGRATWVLLGSGWPAMCALFCALSLLGGAARAATINVPADQTTIGAAVAAATAGDTIVVAAGTYPELVTVDKQLTLQGANAGVNPNNAVRGAETIVNGNSGTTSFYVTASDVVIDGFTVRDQTNVNQFGAGIVLGAGTAGSEVRNNIIKENVVGLFLANNSAVNQTVIEKNLFDNNDNAGAASGHGIYTDEYVAGGPLTNVLIDNNRFINHDGAGAIGFSSTSAASQSSIMMSNNTFDGNLRAIYALNLTNSTFTDNQVSNSTFTGSADLRLFNGVSNVAFTNNVLIGSGNDMDAMRISDESYPGGLTSNVTFNCNLISGYGGDGLEISASGYTGSLDAEDNWWGSVTGPTIASNPGGTGEAIVDPATQVDYSPWKTTNAATCPSTNNPPVADDESASVNENSGPTAIDVLTGDTDADTDPLTIASATDPANGTVVITGGGTGLTYQPDASFVGTDTFDYTASDGKSGDTGSVGTVTIYVLPSISITDVAVNEGDSGSTNAAFTVSLSGASAQTVTVDAKLSDGSATAPTDYTVNLAQGKSATQSSTIVNPPYQVGAGKAVDGNVDGNLNNTPSNSVTHTDQESQPWWEVDLGSVQDIGDIKLWNRTDSNGDRLSDFYVFVSDTAFGPAPLDPNNLPVGVMSTHITSQPNPSVEIPINRTGQFVRVQLSGTDFLSLAEVQVFASQAAQVPATTTTLTFAPGETTKFISVPVLGNTTYELDETYFVDLSNAVNATIADGHGVGTITNDDIDPAQTGPALVVNSTDDHDDGVCGTTDCTLREAITAANDYNSANANVGATITFASPLFDTPQTITLGGTALPNIASDITITGSTAGVTINGANTSRIITINVGQVAFVDLTFTGANVSGSGGGAFYNNSGTLSVTGCTFYGNTADTGSAFSNSGTVTLTNCTVFGNNATTSDGGAINSEGTLTLNNCTIAGNTAVSGVSGISNSTIGTLTMGNTILANSGGNILNGGGTVTSNGYNLSSDAAGGDGTTGPGGLLNSPGDIRNTDPLLDTLADNGGPTQTMALLAGSPAINKGNDASAPATDQRGVARPQGLHTDIGAFEAFLLKISDVTVVEGDTGVKGATFTVTLSSASSQTVTVDYASADGTAKAPGDYTTKTGTLTFAPSETSKTVTVAVLGDTLSESNENFKVDLTNPTNAGIGDSQGLGTITDNDAEPNLRINDVTVVEGDSGAKGATFTVTLSKASGRTVSVNYATTDDTAKTPGDYTTKTGTLTFAPGETSKTLTVPVLGDTVDERDETYFVNLSSALHAGIGDNQGVGTITDNDPAPTLSINDVTVVEGDSGAKGATFTVTLSKASERTVSVNYATADGSATAPGDYTFKSGTLTFLPGQTSRTFVVPVMGDTVVEGTESYLVNLSSPINATVADGSGMGTITDNDVAPAVSIVAAPGSDDSSDDSQ